MQQSTSSPVQMCPLFQEQLNQLVDSSTSNDSSQMSSETMNSSNCSFDQNHLLLDNKTTSLGCARQSVSSSSSASSSSAKHIPHREKPPHVVAHRNARERKRVKSVNEAFECLRGSIKTLEKRTKRVSKVKTLKMAIDYICKLKREIKRLDEQFIASDASEITSNQFTTTFTSDCFPPLAHHPPSNPLIHNQEEEEEDHQIISFDSSNLVLPLASDYAVDPNKPEIYQTESHVQPLQSNSFHSSNDGSFSSKYVAQHPLPTVVQSLDPSSLPSSYDSICHHQKPIIVTNYSSHSFQSSSSSSSSPPQLIQNYCPVSQSSHNCQPIFTHLHSINQSHLLPNVSNCQYSMNNSQPIVGYNDCTYVTSSSSSCSSSSSPSSSSSSS